MTIDGFKKSISNAFEFTPSQVLVSSFAAIILIGALLLTMPFSARPGVTVSFIDALFTSTSAVCVTGLTCIDTVSSYSVPGQIVIMCLIQFGGLGIITLVTFAMANVGQRISLKFRMFAREDRPSHSSIDLVDLIKYVLKITFTIELIGALLLFIAFKNKGIYTLKAAYYGVFHAVSAFCNAGFALFGDNLMSFDTNIIVNLVITSLIILGGLGFNTIVDILYYFRKKTQYHLSLNTKIVLVTTVILLVAGTLVIFAIEYSNPNTIGKMSFFDKLLASYFQSVTTRTAGFNTIDNAKMYLPTVLITIMLMFMGASPGGTGGGIKTTTVAILFKAMLRPIYDDAQIVVFKKAVPKESVSRALAVFTVSLLLVMAGVFALSFTEKTAFVRMLFEVVSAFGTVGLSLGLTPNLTAIGKIVITAIMFLGRVGSLTVIVALAKQKPRIDVKYPEETVLIG